MIPEEGRLIGSNYLHEHCIPQFALETVLKYARGEPDDLPSWLHYLAEEFVFGDEYISWLRDEAEQANQHGPYIDGEVIDPELVNFDVDEAADKAAVDEDDEPPAVGY